MQDHRPCGVLDQNALDIPHDLLALVPVELARLRGQQLVDLGVAVLRVIALRVAGIVLHHIAVGVVDADTGEIEPDGVFLAREF